MRGSAAALVTPAGDGIEQVHRFKAPLLNRLLDNPEDPEQRAVVLDLGRVSQSLLERLSASRPCRIEIADLVADGGLSEIDRIDSLDDDDASGAREPARIRELLPPSNNEPLDLILCWDLPNYLSLGAIRMLIDSIADRIAPQCRLHMLIGYSKRDMPALPGRYVPGTEGSLTQILVDDEITEAPRYSPEDLGLALGNFNYERGVLLANGMQEFVYAWPGEPGAARPY